MSWIFHITSASLWEQGVGSHCGDTLDSEGFIHCSTAAQVVPVANALFRGRRDLVLLRISTDRLTAEVRYESLEGGSERFPHVYGPIEREAVASVEPLRPGPDGAFLPTPSLSEAG